MTDRIRDEERRALEKGIAEERAKGWRFNPERSAEEESALADKLHHASSNRVPLVEVIEKLRDLAQACIDSGEHSDASIFVGQVQMANAILDAIPNVVAEPVRAFDVDQKTVEWLQWQRDKAADATRNRAHDSLWNAIADGLTKHPGWEDDCEKVWNTVRDWMADRP